VSIRIRLVLSELPSHLERPEFEKLRRYGVDLITLGEKVYRGGNHQTGVSACMSCHGPSGHGIPPRFPRLSGQHPAYVENQLLSFKSAKRTNEGDTMTRIAFRMSEREIKAVAEYISGLH